MSNDFQNIGQSFKSFALNDVTSSTETISKAFDKVSKDITKSLESAAKSGSLSMKNLASSIIKDLEGVAINQYVTKPITNIISNIGQSVLNYGSRAGGGAVNVGGAYLVGENGPEMFVPNTSGKIDNSIGQNINIHINMAQGSNLSDVKRSANQVSAALARAVNRGVGNL